VEAQGLLDEGLEVPDAARQLGILTNTLHKAIRAGRLHKRGKKKDKSWWAAHGSGRTASQRSVADSEAALGCATTESVKFRANCRRVFGRTIRHEFESTSSGP
jgi:hypothetical protein